MYINSSPHHTSITFRVGGEPCKMTKGKREMILTRNSTTKLFSKLSRSTRQSSGRVHAGRTCLRNSRTTPATEYVYIYIYMYACMYICMLVTRANDLLLFSRALSALLVSSFQVFS